jgi:AraC-like DNA-binding protein
MVQSIPEGPLRPPPGRPSWGGQGNLPLLYLGWGMRDYLHDPLVVHFDRGADYHILLRGEIVIKAGNYEQTVRGPAALIFNPNFPFGIRQKTKQRTEVLVWIWQGRPRLRELRPPNDRFLALDLGERPLSSLIDLHVRCRNEVSRADTHLPQTLRALRGLVEVEILRASGASAATSDIRLDLAISWMKNNFSISAPIPALCDYLGMSASTLHRFFRSQVGHAPGVYFRDLKIHEARRLIQEEGWQVKAAAYHLGYNHPNDLSRSMGIWERSRRRRSAESS